MTKIYCASPFFTEEELKHVQDVENALSNHIIFSPRQHQLEQHEFGSRAWRTDVYRNDVNHIKWCDVVVAILTQGNYDDVGTAMEVGYATALGKPVVVYNPSGKIQNLMVSDSLHAYIEDLDELKNYDFNTLPIIPYEKEVV